MTTLTELSNKYESSSVVWELDNNEFNVADGVYKFRTTMFDYNNPDADNVFMVWESDLPVTMTQGYMNVDQALAAAAHLIDSCGYWGRFLESIEFDESSNTFDINIGS